METKLKKIKISEMKYSKMPKTAFTKDFKPIILAEGTLLGVEFKIINNYTHPCSYIKLPKKSKWIKYTDSMSLIQLSKDRKKNKKTYDNIPISVHGGITFKGKMSYLGRGVWLGWDYAHYGDYVAFEMNLPKEMRKKFKVLDNAQSRINHHWTTDELIEQMVQVITDIRKKHRKEFFG